MIISTHYSYSEESVRGRADSLNPADVKVNKANSSKHKELTYKDIEDGNAELQKAVKQMEAELLRVGKVIKTGEFNLMEEDSSISPTNESRQLWPE